MDRSGLQQILSKTGDFAVLVTAIPHTDGEQQQRCGKTCVLLSLGDAVHLVDSHPRHPSDGQPAGMLRASVTSSHTSERAKVMCDWMWADDGFFKELRCNGTVVDATVFRNAAPAKARPKDPSASAASSQSSARAASSPGVAGPHRSGSTECVGSDVRVGQDIPGCLSGGAGAPRPPPKAVVPMTVLSEHDEIHPNYVKGCAQCSWRRNGQRWQQQFTFQHPTTGQTVSPIMEKPAGWPGAWGIGCSLCADAAAMLDQDRPWRPCQGMESSPDLR